MIIETTTYNVANRLVTGPSPNVSGLWSGAFGDGNTVSNNASLAVGSSNNISGIRSFCVGESHTVATGGSSALGFFHNINGDRGFATGQHNRCDGVNNAAFGFGVRSVRFAEVAFATSYNSTGRDGGSQHSFITAHKYTTNNTPIKMSLNYDDTAFINLEDNTTYAFEVTVVAKNVTTPGENAVYKLLFEAERASGVATTEINGLVKTDVFKDVAAWDVTATADTTNGRVDIVVTGDSTDTVHWAAKIAIVQVK